MATTTMPITVGSIELLVETRSTAVPGSQPTAKLAAPTEKAVDAFDRAQQAIVEVARSTVAMIKDMTAEAARPDQVQVTFGLSFSAQGNIIMVGASGQASLSVTLTYNASHP